MRKIIFYLTLTIAFQSYGQGYLLAKSTTSISSGTNTIGNLFVSQTIGQPSLVSSFQSNGIQLVQGFEIAKTSDEPKHVQVTFEVFPNPTSGPITIDLKEGITEAFQLILYDLKGNHVLHQEIESSDRLLELDLTFLTKGIYYLNISSESVNQSHKILIK